MVSVQPVTQPEEMAALVVGLAFPQVPITVLVVVTAIVVKRVTTPALNAAALGNISLHANLAKQPVSCTLAVAAGGAICRHKALLFPLVEPAVEVQVRG